MTVGYGRPCAPPIPTTHSHKEKKGEKKKRPVRKMKRSTRPTAGPKIQVGLLEQTYYLKKKIHN